MESITDLKAKVDVPVVVADHQGLITFVNGEFEKVFGWPALGIIGKSLTAIIPGDFHDAHNLGFSRFVVSGKPTLLNQPLKLKAITRDGRVFEAEHIIVAERLDGNWLFAATIRPLESL